MFATADDAGLPVFKALGWSYMARATARNGRLEEALTYLAQAEELAEKMQLRYVDMLLWIARAWVHCDSNRHADCVDTVNQGLAFCEEIQSLPFYRLTLRCAALWSGVEEMTKGSDPLQGDAQKLQASLRQFQEDSAIHGVVQFEGIARQLLARVEG
jgi:hypothetical protein